MFTPFLQKLVRVAKSYSKWKEDPIYLERADGSSR